MSLQERVVDLLQSFWYGCVVLYVEVLSQENQGENANTSCTRPDILKARS